MTRQTPFVIAILAMLVGGSSLAAALEAPVPHPEAINWTPDGHQGFDWANMPNTTHIVLDAIHASNSINTASIPTPYLAIEVTGLKPAQPVDVIDTTTGAVTRDYAYPTGHLVLWDRPAVPGTLVLRDRSDGSTLTTIMLTGQTKEAGCTACVGTTPHPPCTPCGRTPQVIHSDPPTLTWVTLNGAWSPTSEVTVAVSTGWSHSNVFEAKGEFGYAATIQAQRNYAWAESANVFIQSQGAGQVGRAQVYARRDYYDDGSSVVYATSPAYSYSSEGWNWNPTKCCRTYILENSKTNGPQGFALREAGSGAIRWGGAWTYGPFTGSATTTSTHENTAAVTFTFRAPDDARHTYTWNVVSGDGAANGMVGYVFKDS